MKIFRITTVPISLKILLKGQLRYFNEYFEVVGVSSPSDELYEVANNEGVRVVGVKMRRQISMLNDFIALMRLYKLFRDERPIIIHTHTPKAGMLGMVAGLMAKVPIRIHTVAGLPLMEEVGAKRLLLNVLEWFTYACSTRVYPNSNGLKRFILENGFCSDAKLKVIANGSSNGIDTTYFAPNMILDETKRELRTMLQLNSHDFIFIFIGRLVKDKGVNELISVFVKLQKKHPNAKLILVGEEEAELDPLSQKTVQIIKSNKAIITTGFQQDIRPYLAISDVLVFPSYREGFPNVPMQAGAMGLPAIVTNINGCNEIIISGENGEIIPPHDEHALLEVMSKWMSNPDKVKHMASRSRELIVSRFEQKVVWEELLKEYKMLLNEIGIL